MSITAGELIKRLQTYPEDQEVRISGSDCAMSGAVLETMPVPPELWYMDGKVIFEEDNEEKWERGPNGDDPGHSEENAGDECIPER